MAEHYTLAGDRGIEYGFAGARIPRTVSGRCLDFGPGPRARLAREAVRKGWSVLGVDLQPCKYVNPAAFAFCRGDLLRMEVEGWFGLVLNVSTVEHVGVPGRYGVEDFDADADLRAMEKLRALMTPEARMILTVPLGQDDVLTPFHRVYGRLYLPQLLAGFRVVEQQYWRKVGDVDAFVPCGQNDALGTRATLEPAHYYAIGGFVLARRPT